MPRSPLLLQQREPGGHRSGSCFLRQTMRRAGTTAPRTALRVREGVAGARWSDTPPTPGSGSNLAWRSGSLRWLGEMTSCARTSVLRAESSAQCWLNAGGEEMLREPRHFQAVATAAAAQASPAPSAALGGSSKASSMPARVMSSTFASAALGLEGKCQSCACFPTMVGAAALSCKHEGARLAWACCNAVSSTALPEAGNGGSCGGGGANGASRLCSRGG
mmetsp:Transcript_62790/g.141826  ORF Transcript_62790/g.141826 Transcript_62790/m.141826 type:complete len:220 (+) Transcript_62790:223-882(+)